MIINSFIFETRNNKKQTRRSEIMSTILFDGTNKNQLIYFLKQVTMVLIFVLQIQMTTAIRVPGCDVQCIVHGCRGKNKAWGQGPVHRPPVSGAFTLDNNIQINEGCRMELGTYSLTGRTTTDTARPIILAAPLRNTNLFACTGPATCTIKGIEITGQNQVGGWGMLQLRSTSSGDPTTVFDDIKISDSIGYYVTASTSYTNYLISYVLTKSVQPTTSGITIRKSIFTDTIAGGNGGFVYVDGCNNLNIEDTTFHGNKNLNPAINILSTKTTILRSTFTSNEMTASDAKGGAALYIVSH